MLFASIRLLFDIRAFGITALRDFATVYYCSFFFLVHRLALEETSRRFFEKFLALGLFLLIPLFPLFRQFPAFFYYKLNVDNVPLIFYKGDLVASMFSVGFVFFYLKYFKNRSTVLFLISIACMLMALYSTSRAAWVGLALALGVLFFAGIRLVFQHLVIVLICCIIPSAIIFGLFAENLTQTRVYAVYEHAISLVDFSGTGRYRNPESRNTGDNNRYRLVWWRIVIEDTLRQAPLTGLGFGTDISERFGKTYFTTFKTLRARSPHSIVLSVFGRMGIIGLALFLIVVSAMIYRTLEVINLARVSATLPESLIYWCMVWAIFGSACFGVVLEGPMGAIPFWTFLGIANALAYEECKEFATNPVNPTATQPVPQPAF